ncbi:hypothetical protein KAS50_00605, partial [bacterium]|nr:hypothetical protein [bacterium]
MKVKKVLLFLLLCTVFLINIENMRGAAPTASSILSPRDGYFEAYIVIPARATGTERYAADELAEHIKEITGTEILVIREKPELKYFGFYIGKTVKGGSYAPPSRRQYNGSNGFRIKRLSDGLVIAGGDDLSTLYGVYEFLEKYQGCAWFLETELGEIVPKAESINIPENLDITMIPDIPIRWMNSGGWALKNKMNVSININGHPEGVINKWNYHTYRVLVPDDKYFDDHPEYFSIKRGKRVPGNDRAQLCTTNPELIKLVTQHLIYELKR